MDGTERAGLESRERRDPSLENIMKAENRINIRVQRAFFYKSETFHLGEKISR